MTCLYFPFVPQHVRAAPTSRLANNGPVFIKAVIGLILLSVVSAVGCAGNSEIARQTNDASDSSANLPIVQPVEITRSGGGKATLQLAQGALWVCGLAIAPSYLRWKYNFIVTGLSVGAVTQFESDGQVPQSDFPVSVVWDGALRTFNLVDMFRVSAVRTSRTINITADPPISAATIRETVGDWAVACEPV